jgi:hypothetical protein
VTKNAAVPNDSLDTSEERSRKSKIELDEVKRALSNMTTRHRAVTFVMLDGETSGEH